MRTRFAVSRDASFQDVLAGAPVRVLTDEEREVAGFLVGKTYAAIEVIEVADYDGLERFPYIRATSGSVNYGSEAMGLGELCLLLTLWTLQDIERGGVLILEEPENHVSPRSQEALANVLARASDKQKIWVIAVTHSPAIANCVSLDHIKLVTRDAVGSIVIGRPTRTQIAAVLGGGVAFRSLALAEDEAGRKFLMGILAELDPDLAAQIEVVVAGGVSNITTALQVVPQSERGWFSVVGVYDGDQRVAQLGDCKWPRVFLPGECSPEEILRKSALDSSNDGRLADLLGRSQEQVAIALQAADGLDHHDWLPAVARALGLSSADATLALIRLWLATESNKSLAEQLLSELRTALSRK